MIVLVCGGRNYADRQRVYTTLTKINDTKGIRKIVCGGAKGADRLAADWALANNVNLCTYNATWNTHGLSAGIKRNQLMLDREDIDLVVAFPGSRGTAHMKQLAQDYAIDVMEILNGS